MDDECRQGRWLPGPCTQRQKTKKKGSTRRTIKCIICVKRKPEVIGEAAGYMFLLGRQFCLQVRKLKLSRDQTLGRLSNARALLLHPERYGRCFDVLSRRLPPLDFVLGQI